MSAKLSVMFRKATASLLFRFGIIALAIVILAIAGAAISLLTAYSVKGEANSINMTGSLRMQSYQIGTTLFHDNQSSDTQYQEQLQGLVKSFEQQLYSDSLVRLLPSSHDDELLKAYQHIIMRWQDEIRPLLDLYIDGLTQEPPIAQNARINIRTRYLAVLPLFVDDIDHLVDLLAVDAEGKIDHLYLYQIISIFAISLLVGFSLHMTGERITKPLKDLLALAARTRRGDFSTRTSYEGNDELGRLGNALNLMSSDLHQLYQDLENRVKEKTNDLERSKRSLELLYRTVKQLHTTSDITATYQKILEDIQNLAKTGPGMICLSDNPLSGATSVASTFPDEQVLAVCQQENCKVCLGGINHHPHLLPIEELQQDDDQHILATPISDQVMQYGVLLVQIPATEHFDDWKKKLLESIAKHIGISQTLIRQQTEHRRVALLEERSVIARELHDSLAQALTYLKIQVIRLEDSIPSVSPETADIIHELNDGLGSAYRELRELLTTFRLRMDENNFETALQSTVKEFGRRSDTQFRLDYQLKHCELTANEEIHLLQIARETLSNVINHAKASNCLIVLSRLNGQIILSIEDDGIGLGQHDSKTHHYGISIMNERARILGGKIKLGKSTPGGTQMTLTFTPSQTQDENNKETIDHHE